MDEYSISSISNKESIIGYPIINQKQILLDWINTINEPLCLLVSEINDLLDGKVFIELLKHYLFLKNQKNLITELNSRLSNTGNNPFQIIIIVIDIFSKISNENERKLLNNFNKNIPQFFQDENKMIEFISIIKNIYNGESNLEFNITNDFEELKDNHNYQNNFLDRINDNIQIPDNNKNYGHISNDNNNIHSYNYNDNMQSFNNNNIENNIPENYSNFPPENDRNYRFVHNNLRKQNQNVNYNENYNQNINEDNFNYIRNPAQKNVNIHSNFENDLNSNINNNNLYKNKDNIPIYNFNKDFINIKSQKNKPLEYSEMPNIFDNHNQYENEIQNEDENQEYNEIYEITDSLINRKDVNNIDIDEIINFNEKKEKNYNNHKNNKNNSKIQNKTNNNNNDNNIIQTKNKIQKNKFNNRNNNNNIDLNINDFKIPKQFLTKPKNDETKKKEIKQTINTTIKNQNQKKSNSKNKTQNISIKDEYLQEDNPKNFIPNNKTIPLSYQSSILSGEEQNKSLIKEKEFKDLSSQRMSNINNYSTQKDFDISNNNISNYSNLYINKKEMQVINNSSFDISPSKINKKNNSNSKIYIKRNPIYNKNKSNLYNRNYDNSFVLTNEDNLKTYNKKQKAIINMTRGIQLINNKFFHVELGNLNYNYLKFIKTSEPIVEISYNDINKYKPLAKNIENNTNINTNNLVPKKQISKKNYDLSNRKDTNYYINKEKISNSLRNQINYREFSQLNNNILQDDIIIKSQLNNINNNINTNNTIEKNNQNNIYENINNNINNNNNTNNIQNKNIINQIKNNNINLSPNLSPIETKINDSIPQNIKSKVYYWLIDIGIIKEKKIKIDDLPLLCINGVLFCDLINRCEGKNEIIKGIIRKTKTKSDIQVNINKVLEYLRSIERFSSRHLWNNTEIARGDRKIIWELLEDICNYYSRNFSKNRIINRSKSSLQNRIHSFNKFTSKNFNTKSNVDTLNLSGTPNSNSKMNLDFNISDISYVTSPNVNNNNFKNNVINYNNNKNSNFNNEKKNLKKKNKNEILNTSNNTNSNNFNHMNDNDEEMFNLNLNIKKPIYRQKKTLTSNNSYKQMNTGNNIKRNKSESKFRYGSNRINTTVFSNKDATNTTMNQSCLTASKANNNSTSCFLLFEKSTAKRMRSEIGRIKQYSDMMKNNPSVNQDLKPNMLLMNLIGA